MQRQPMGEEFIALGKTELRVSPMGAGAWQWGDRFLWGFGVDYGEEEAQAAFTASLEAGVNFFDTAEMYGRGRSERILGRCIRNAKKPVVVATKFFPFPWRLSRSSLIRALRRSLKRLGQQSVDLYYIHWPMPPIPIEARLEALADAADEGLAHALGVSNFDAQQTRRAVHALAGRGYPLACNQISYSLVQRRAETDGTLAECFASGVTPVAYSPLAQGLLTGKYSPQAPPKGLRGIRANRELLSKAQALVGLQREIGEGHGGKTAAQVAINWIICKGAVPIPGAKNARQARENAGALGWRLTAEEVAALDAASGRVLTS
jgi:aryl-alcohol dehydrogenase-like predicted oxidoreductase